MLGSALDSGGCGSAGFSALHAAPSLRVRVVSVAASLLQTVALSADGRVFTFGSKQRRSNDVATDATTASNADVADVAVEGDEVCSVPMELCLDVSLPPPPLSAQSMEEARVAAAGSEDVDCAAVGTAR